MTNESYGLSVVYGVRCSYETLVCNNKDQFYLAWLYLLAIQLTIQRQFSNQINRWTLNQKEAEDLRIYFEMEYQRILKQTCDSINLSLRDCCLECDAPINIVTHIP